MMVMYPLLSLNLFGQSVLELESGNGNVDGETNGQKKGRKADKTNRLNHTNFEKNLAMMVIYLLIKFEFD